MSIAVTAALGLVHWSGIASRRSVTTHLNAAVGAVRLPASVAVTVIPVVTDLVVGAVPEISPVDALMVSQLGRPVAEYVSGLVPLLTREAMLRLSTVLTKAVCVAGVVIVG